MYLIPGLELRNGVIAYPKAQHAPDEEALIYLDPRETVQKLVDAGAKRVHLIDADGASSTEPSNTGVVEVLRKHFPKLVIQVTGGIRRIEHAETWLDVGADFVVIGWKILRNPQTTSQLCAEYPNRVIVALEASDGRVMTGPDNYVDVIELAGRYSDDGVSAIFYTELQQAGERRDPLPRAAALAKKIDIPVLCNGGVHDLDAASNLKTSPLNHLQGVVIGRALLNGSLAYADVLSASTR